MAGCCSIEIDLKTTENEEERLKLLQQLIDNKRDYERHIGRDVEMRKITHWLQDKAVLHETGEQRSYDERADYENWKIFTKIHCMLREAIESVWKIIAHPATSMEPCLVPTVSDNKGIVETSIFDIIFQGCDTNQMKRLGVSPHLFFKIATSMPWCNVFYTVRHFDMT